MTTVHGTGINGILDREEYGACNKVEKRRTSLCRILENLTEKFSLIEIKMLTIGFAAVKGKVGTDLSKLFQENVAEHNTRHRKNNIISGYIQAPKDLIDL